MLMLDFISTRVYEYHSFWVLEIRHGNEVVRLRPFTSYTQAKAVQQRYTRRFGLY